MVKKLITEAGGRSWSALIASALVGIGGIGAYLQSTGALKSQGDAHYQAALKEVEEELRAEYEAKAWGKSIEDRIAALEGRHGQRVKPGPTTEPGEKIDRPQSWEIKQEAYRVMEQRGLAPPMGDPHVGDD